MASVIRVNIPFDGRTRYIVADDEGIRILTWKNYNDLSHDQYFAVDDYYELSYPDKDAAPYCIINLLNIPMNVIAKSAERQRQFNDALLVAMNTYNEKRGKTPMATSAAIKGIMLFNADENINTYMNDVFVWDSVNGVQRCTFPAYLAQVESEHSGTYKMVKLSMARVQGLALSDFKWLKQARIPRDGDKSEKMYMVFRSLWYAATGEEMSI